MARAYHAPKNSQYDVVIIGGAVIGSSSAYWLTQQQDFNGSILVIERDSTYQFASTTLSSSSIRQQFSNPINVKISQFGVEFIRNFPTTMADAFDDGCVPELGFRENGYLMCCSPAGADACRERVEMQQSLGAGTVFLSPGEIADRFPYMNVDDLGGGSWGRGAEGWFDSNGLMNGFRSAARRGGAEYIDNEVIGLTRENGVITTVQLATGETISCGTVVNAAGPRAQMISRMGDMDIPVEPRRRHTFIFASAEPVPGAMPCIIDMDGTYVRPEGQMFMTGNTPLNDGPAAVDDFTTEHGEFDRIWPSLAHRIPQFETIKLQNFWTGHYAYNTLDHNAIVGRHPEVTNFIFANGFSGHGLQQSPAVGRAVSELICHNEYRTLDLTPFCYERVERNEPFLEDAVI